jgi:hypothetical protein
LLVQTLGAAVSAWLVLGERFSAIQALGGLVIVGAITLARSARKVVPAAAHAPSAAPAAMPEPAAACNSVSVVRD